MRHWSRLAIRNWWARSGRTFGAVAAIAVGAAAVVWVTCSYESVRQTMTRWSTDYIGKSQITVSSPKGKYDQIPSRMARALEDDENVRVVAPRLSQRLQYQPWPKSRIEADERPPKNPAPAIGQADFHGIDPAVEYEVRSYTLSGGRLLSEQDDLDCMLERPYADEAGLGVGDSLVIWTETEASPYLVRIVGVFEWKRVGRLQKPMILLPLATLQRMTSKFALVTTLDIALKDTSDEAVQDTGSRLRRPVRRIDPSATMRTAEARMKQIELAQTNQRTVLVMLSCVAMLTALFIILSTLSMGMIERIGQLGLLRCVGMTRMQLAALVLLEVFPIGLLGIGLGIPLGLGLALVTVWLVPEYVGSFAISWSGLALAGAAGLITTLVAGLMPAMAALRVSPLEAAHPRARGGASWLVYGVAILAGAVLLAQELAVVDQLRRSVQFLRSASLAVVLLYVGYAMLSPLAVRWVGAPAVYLAAGALRIRARLLQDQVGVAVWRSAGICCGLMVGLSLIISVVVVNQSVTSGWQFPKQFPAAFIWSYAQLRSDASEAVRSIPGVENATAANAINVIVEEVPAFGAEVLRSVTWFMGIEPDSFFDLIRLEFLEGDPQTAKALLEQGGYVLIADDFARSRNKKLGDTVPIFYGTTVYQRTDFKVAGVVRSPAIDIAANYFQLHTEYNVVAAGSVVGTNADMKARFGVDGAKLVLLNFEPFDEPVPPEWPPPRDSAEGRLMLAESFNEELPRETRWRRWREERIMREARRELGAPQADYGTVAELKDGIDAELTQMMRLLTAVPTVALIVAAMGVANLMTANVAARSKQLAILRAVGATRGLILRMVVGEAVVLGLLGSGMGLALGMHLASNITELVDRMWGFRVAMQMPWAYLAAAIALTVGLCVIAGVAPARRAARTNIVDALHVS